MRNGRKCWFTVQGDYLAVRVIAGSRQCRKEFSSEIVIPFLWPMLPRSCPVYVPDSFTLLICHFRPGRCPNPHTGSAYRVLSISSGKSLQKMYSLGQKALRQEGCCREGHSPMSYWEDIFCIASWNLCMDNERGKESVVKNSKSSLGFTRTWPGYEGGNVKWFSKLFKKSYRTVVGKNLFRYESSAVKALSEESSLFYSQWGNPVLSM